MTLFSDQIESLRPGFEAAFADEHDPETGTKRQFRRNVDGKYRGAVDSLRFEGWIAAKSTPVLITPEMGLSVRSYQVGNSDVTIAWRAPDSWAVCRSSFCLASDGEWEVESLPSSRTDDFIARCRLTLPEATRRANEYVAALNPGAP